MPDITIDLSGPLLTGAPSDEIDRFLRDAQQTVGQAALSEVEMLLDRSIRNPTPYYETQIIHERLGRENVVHDRGIIYGPWLEGTGSRNRTTRFKGYSSFRRAAQTIELQVPRLIERHVDELVRRLS